MAASWPPNSECHRRAEVCDVTGLPGIASALLRPMRGMKCHRSVRVFAAGHAFVQNLCRGHYDIATDTPDRHRLRIAFGDLALTI